MAGWPPLTPGTTGVIVKGGLVTRRREAVQRIADLRHGLRAATELEVLMMNSAEPPNRAGPGQMLSLRQRKIVEVIAGYLRDHGCSPSNRDIAEGAGLASASSVNH